MSEGKSYHVISLRECLGTAQNSIRYNKVAILAMDAYFPTPVGKRWKCLWWHYQRTKKIGVISTPRFTKKEGYHASWSVYSLRHEKLLKKYAEKYGRMNGVKVLKK